MMPSTRTRSTASRGTAPPKVVSPPIPTSRWASRRTLPARCSEVLGYIRDRKGAIVASPAVKTRGFPGLWSDDGQHYCSVVSKSALPPAGGEPATLQLTAVGQAPRNVIQVGKMYDQASA